MKKLLAFLLLFISINVYAQGKVVIENQLQSPTNVFPHWPVVLIINNNSVLIKDTENLPTPANIAGGYIPLIQEGEEQGLPPSCKVKFGQGDHTYIVLGKIVFVNDQLKAVNVHCLIDK